MQQSKPDEVKNAVEIALKSGYRHIDAAACYDNEKEVGEGIEASGVDRKDIFVSTPTGLATVPSLANVFFPQLTSKLWNTHHRAEDVERQLDCSLADLQTDYVDLYLVSRAWVAQLDSLLPSEFQIHWPVAFRMAKETERFPINEDTCLLDIIDVHLVETWKAMEALVRKGKIKSIGVSNFSIDNLVKVWQAAEIKPVVNQVELHPYFPQKELLDWCRERVGLPCLMPSDDSN